MTRCVGKFKWLIAIASLCILLTVNVSEVNADSLDYDSNGNGEIERDEALAAIIDYFQDKATREDVLEVIGLYFSPPTAEPTPTPTPIPTSTPEEAIAALPWVQDGMTHYELSVVRLLKETVASPLLGGYGDDETFWEVMRHPGINRIDEDTGQLPVAVGYVAHLAPEIHYYDRSDTLPRLMGMPFMESIELLDTIPLRLLDELLAHSPSGSEEVYRIMSHPSLKDGITDEQTLTPLLLYLEGQDPDLAAQVAALSWIEDGIDDSEYYSALYFQDVALDSTILFRAYMDKPWVQDGLDRSERAILFYLGRLVSHPWWEADPTGSTYLDFLALDLMRMPFLETVEPGDAPLLHFLTSAYGNSIDWYLANKEMIGEITDERRSRLAAVYALPRDRSGGVANKETHLVEVILDPSKSVVQERMVTLPLTGDMHLIAVQTDGYPHYLRSLERAVRAHEEFMGVPLPYQHSLVTVADIDGGGFYTGRGSMVIDIGYRQTSQDAVQGVIAHETGHIYWSYYTPWIDEGAAVFLERVSQGMFHYGYDFRIGMEACYGEFASYNLDELERQGGLVATHCAYVMGSGIFYDLYHGLGREAFREGFTKLYLNRHTDRTPSRLPIANRSEAGKVIGKEAWYDGVKHEDCSLLVGRAWTLCSMKRAFVAGFDPETAVKADQILKLWFFTKPPGQ